MPVAHRLKHRLKVLGQHHVGEGAAEIRDLAGGNIQGVEPNDIIGNGKGPAGPLLASDWLTGVPSLPPGVLLFF